MNLIVEIIPKETEFGFFILTLSSLMYFNLLLSSSVKNLLKTQSLFAFLKRNVT